MTSPRLRENGGTKNGGTSKSEAKAGNNEFLIVAQTIPLLRCYEREAFKASCHQETPSSPICDDFTN
jgi:hypothetical protein